MTPPEGEREQPAERPPTGGAPANVRPPLSPRYMAAAGAVIGATYAIGAILRGTVLAGIVGGILAAILTYLVLREAGERRRRRNRGS